MVMESVEGRTMGMQFWKRYIDDTCCVISKDEVGRFHSHINSVELCTQFTVKIELHGKLPFWDELMTREDDGSISTSVYRKPTHTNKYLEFTSHHPTIHKSAVVRTLFNCTEKVSSSLVEKTAEERRLFGKMGTQRSSLGVDHINHKKQRAQGLLQWFHTYVEHLK